LSFKNVLEISTQHLEKHDVEEKVFDA
jgi:hypothetical protein